MSKIWQINVSNKRYLLLKELIIKISSYIFDGDRKKAHLKKAHREKAHEKKTHSERSALG